MIDRLGSDVSSDEDKSFKDKNDTSSTNVNELSTAKLRINLFDEEIANIVYNSLVVDKEPKRSTAVRTLSVDKTFLVADISCSDPKFLQKSTTNFFEMCELARSGLKSKLEDEAKRIQATVSQYSENIAQQVRSGTSENGSDISSYTRRFFPSNSSNSVEDYAKNRKSSLLSTDNHLFPTETIVSLDDDDQNLSTNQSAIFQEFDESDFFSNELDFSQQPQRFRRLSNTSLESNESAFVFPQSSAPATLRLDTISSDIESSAGSIVDPTNFENIEKEQLKGRATNYKQRYYEVAKAYQEVLRENDKYRTVLAKTQDKALQRISKLKSEKRELLERFKNVDEHKSSKKLEEKNVDSKIQRLQDLLEKCKDRITTYKSQLIVLNEENTSLKNKLTNNGQSELSVEKVTAEWKGRVDRLEEEWQKRLSSCDEKATIAIATFKAEMHVALQQKDQEIEDWISKYHLLEKKETEGKIILDGKVNELEKVIETLENEKADMVEKLSKAKQEGVKLVKEDEEKKREKLNTEHNEKLVIELMKKDDEWRKKMKELEEQMQLAIEESEMQKIAALASQDKKFNTINESLESFKTENMFLQSELDKTLLSLNEETERLNSILYANSDLELQLKKKELDFIELLEKIEGKIKVDDKSEKDSGVEEFELKKSLQNFTKNSLLENVTQQSENSSNILKLLNKQLSLDNNKTEQKSNSLDEEIIILKFEASELKAKNSALKEQLSLLKQQNEDYLKRCSNLEEQSNSINTLLTESKVTVNKMTDKLNKIVAEKNAVIENESLQFSELNDKLDGLYKENAVFKEIIDKNKNESENTQNEKDNFITLLSNQLTENKETISNLKLQLENILNIKEKLIKDIEELENSKLNLQNRYDSLKSNIEELYSEKNELFKEKEKLKKINDENQHLSDSVTQKLLQSEQEVENLRNLINEMRNEKIKLESTQNKNQHSNDSVIQKLLQSEQEVDNLKASIEKISTKNIKIEEEMLNLQTKYSKEKENHESVLKNLNNNKQDLEKLKWTLDEVSADKNLFFEEKNNLELINKQSKELYELTLQNLTAKDDEIAKLMKKIDEQSSEIVILRNKLENETVPLRLEQPISKLEVEKIKKLSEENDVLSKRQIELESLYDSTAKQLIKSESNLEDLKKRLKENSTQKNRLIDQKDSELTKLKSDFEQSSKDNLVLKQRVELANQQNKQLAKRHGELEAICEQKNFSNNRLASEKERIELLNLKNTELSKRCEELEHLCELAKPTETEYLRNVLYRYMIERETLGKEIVTLARVIGTVVKFTKEQLKLVITKEELRFNQSWYGEMLRLPATVGINGGGAAFTNLVRRTNSLVSKRTDYEEM